MKYSPYLVSLRHFSCSNSMPYLGFCHHLISAHLVHLRLWRLRCLWLILSLWHSYVEKIIKNLISNGKKLKLTSQQDFWILEKRAHFYTLALPSLHAVDRCDFPIFASPIFHTTPVPWQSMTWKIFASSCRDSILPVH